jgi:hypothetical protein
VVTFDVNVLVAAHREEHVHHQVAARVLREIAEGPSAFGLVELTSAAFLRLVTSRRVFVAPSDRDVAVAFLEEIRARPTCVSLRPGADHWTIFLTLCREGDATGNLVSDAYLAAIAVEHGCEWLTFDRDFARFPGLRWRVPA